MTFYLLNYFGFNFSDQCLKNILMQTVFSDQKISRTLCKVFYLFIFKYLYLFSDSGYKYKSVN